MLQQTQVKTVLNYYPRFLQRFPTLADLAQANLEEVMPYWAGLGYYARARNLHRCAQTVMQEWQGQFPQRFEELRQLPGIGPSTAAAIAAFAFGERVSILDGNVKRILCRFAGIDAPLNRSQTEKQLWALAQQLLAAAPADLPIGSYTQGLMDLGALVCTRSRPRCEQCPLQPHCHAFHTQTQDLLPQRRPRATIPTRQRHMLIWTNDQHVLLHQRPPTGIWGGLYALPSFKDQQQLTEFVPPRPDTAQPCRLQALNSVQHRFTHFELVIHPWLLQTAVQPQPNPLPLSPRLAADYHWVARHQLEQIALPAPIQRLLQDHLT